MFTVPDFFVARCLSSLCSAAGEVFHPSAAVLLHLRCAIILVESLPPLLPHHCTRHSGVSVWNSPLRQGQNEEIRLAVQIFRKNVLIPSGFWRSPEVFQALGLYSYVVPYPALLVLRLCVWA